MAIGMARQQREQEERAREQRAAIPARGEVRARYHAYQRAAREMAERARQGVAWVTDAVSVEDHPGVQMVEDGAFVEARIWVPRERVEPMLVNVMTRTGAPGEDITR